MIVNRRQMIKTSTLLAFTPTYKHWVNGATYSYLIADVSGEEAILPADKCIPFDWASAEISPEKEGLHLSWHLEIPNIHEAALLRITSATDVREELVLEVKTAKSGKKIAEWDLRFAALLQPFELPILKDDLEAFFKEGIVLKMIKGTKPFWFFTINHSSKSAPDAYLPHLLLYSKNLKTGAWKDRLLSLESMQTFGWQQGIIWDGLLQLSKHSNQSKTVLIEQLELYFTNNSLIYCDLNNVNTREVIHTVESILPFAILAQVDPKHPLLQTAIAFCKSHANTEGIIADGAGNNRMLKTEECYTVSYPLAVLAKTLGRIDLELLAITTLRSRISLLEKDNSIYQRGTEQGELFFENWSRGVAWYLLGLAKTLVHLPESIEKESLNTSFQKSVENVLKYQQSNGLWFNFFHQPETGLETSGTAGIAAALMFGYENKLLPENAKLAAVKARNGLKPYYTPDGYMTGTAQVNKGGDALQKNGFRVISPYTLGFLAHLNN